jgi:hypothetical protein
LGLSRIKLQIKFFADIDFSALKNVLLANCENLTASLLPSETRERQNVTQIKLKLAISQREKYEILLPITYK